MQRVVRFLVASALVASVVGLGGCFDENPLGTDETTVDIILDAIGEISGGANAQVSGTVEASETPVTIEFVILDSANNAISADDGLSVSPSSYVSDDEETVDLAEGPNVTITVTDSACDGAYTLKVQATVGTVVESKLAAFTVTGATDCSQPQGTPVDTQTVTVGAAQASEGSSLDCDLMTVYSTTELRDSATLQATIDVYYGVTSSDSAKIGSPFWASESGWGPQIGGAWLGTPANTQFIKTSLTPAEFDSIETQEEIDALWTGTAESSVVIYADDVVIVETTEGAYCLLKIISASNELTGTAVIKGAIAMND